jgi:hypothetical protein
MRHFARLAALCVWCAALAACQGDQLGKVLDSAALAGACGGTGSMSPPIGGALDALWSPCSDNTTYQVWDGQRFTKVAVPDAVAAQAALPAMDKTLWVTTRDPTVPTTTTPRRLIRLFPDGHNEDHTADVNPTKTEVLALAGVGGHVVIERGMSLYQVAGDKVTALPAPIADDLTVLGVLPVLGDGKLNRFFLHMSVGKGAPTPDSVRVLLWDGSAWQAQTINDPTEQLRYTGLPRIFLPVTGTLYGLASRAAAQDRIVDLTLAKIETATTLSPVDEKISVEKGYFAPQQLYMRQNGEAVILGGESEGNDNVVNRLTYYVFTGIDFRNRTSFQTIQSCAPTECTHSASDPIFLVDGALMYVVSDKDGSFDVLAGML